MATKNQGIVDEVMEGFESMDIWDTVTVTAGALGAGVFITAFTIVLFGYDLNQVLFTLGTTEFTFALTFVFGAIFWGLGTNIMSGGGFALNNVEMIGVALSGLPTTIAVLNQDFYNYIVGSVWLQLAFVVVSTAGFVLIAKERRSFM